MEATNLPEVIKPQAVTVVNTIVETLGDITEYEIAAPAAYQQAGADLKLVKTQAKELESLKREVMQPLNERVQMARDFFKPAEAILERVEKAIKQSMLAWDREQDRIRQEEQRKAREEAEAKAREERERLAAEARERQAELDRKAEEERRAREAELAKANAAKAEQLRREQEEADRKAEEERKRIDAETGAKVAQVKAEVVHVPEVVNKVAGVAKRVIWKHRVTDPDKLPRQYLMPNERLLEQYARTQKEKAQVPGVEFYSEEVIAAGSK